MEIFSFDPEQTPYPSPTHILDTIKPALVAESLFKYSGLEAAARVGSVESLQYFLARLAACNNQNLLIQNSMAAFIAAAENGHIEIVKWFLKNQNLDVNSHINNGCTALILASENGKIDIVKLLLSNENIKINMQTEWGITALMNAARNGHADIVKELLTNKSIDINLKDEHNQTALNMALEKKQQKIISLLLARPEIDLSVSTILLGSSSALILAAENFDNADLINMLLKTQKIDINYQSTFGETALMIAVDNNYYDTAKALIADENLNPNKKDIYGTTVLAYSDEIDQSFRFKPINDSSPNRSVIPVQID